MNKLAMILGLATLIAAPAFAEGEKEAAPAAPATTTEAPAAPAKNMKHKKGHKHGKKGAAESEAPKAN